MGDHRPRGQAAGGGAAALERILIRVQPRGSFPQDRTCDLRERRTAGDRWTPLGTARVRWRVDQTWTIDRSRQGSIYRGAGCRLPLVSSGSGDTGVCLSGDNDAVRGPTTRRGDLGFLRRLLGGGQQQPDRRSGWSSEQRPGWMREGMEVQLTTAARTSRLWARPAIRTTCGASLEVMARRTIGCAWRCTPSWSPRPTTPMTPTPCRCGFRGSGSATFLARMLDDTGPVCSPWSGSTASRSPWPAPLWVVGCEPTARVGSASSSTTTQPTSAFAPWHHPEHRDPRFGPASATHSPPTRRTMPTTWAGWVTSLQMISGHQSAPAAPGA